MRRAWCILVLAGWCLLFLRCETTEKSMVRAVYLSREGTGFQAGMIYQAPEAAADASEASAALQYAQAEGATLAQAIAAAEKALPQTASYRLCDFVLLPDADDALLTGYEQLVLRQGCGRTAAKLSCARGIPDPLDGQKALPDAWMDALKAYAGCMPRLYQLRETILLPCLQWDGKKFCADGGVLHTAAANQPLTDQQAALFYLLTGAGGTQSFWLEGEQITVRRCTVSAMLQKGQVLVRLDCQRAPQSPMPTGTQQALLAQQCLALVQECWQQGVDVLHLQAYAALQGAETDAFDPTKNVCPQLRTDVKFLPA